MSGPDTTSPVSYPINVTRLPAKGLPVWLEADERQREALAREHELEAVTRFRFDLTLARWQGEGLRVSGHVKASIVQNCVVTLQPLTTEIDEEVAALFIPEGSRLARRADDDGGELVLDAEGPDMPETFFGDEVDVGAVAEEFFGLAIDPYPRAGDASLSSTTGGEADDAPRGPLYEKLKGLVDKR